MIKSKVFFTNCQKPLSLINRHLCIMRDASDENNHKEVLGHQFHPATTWGTHVFLQRPEVSAVTEVNMSV